MKGGLGSPGQLGARLCLDHRLVFLITFAPELPPGLRLGRRPGHDGVGLACEDLQEVRAAEACPNRQGSDSVVQQLVPSAEISVTLFSEATGIGNYG